MRKTLWTGIGAGIAFWWLAATVVQQAGPQLFNGNNLHFAQLLAATTLLTGILVWGAQRLARDKGRQLFTFLVVATTTATLLDGIAMTWFRASCYHPDYLISLRGAAWILWGAGMALTAAYWCLPRNMACSAKHTGLAVILGIVFWFNGTLVIQAIGPHLLTHENPYRWVACLVAVPVTAITLLLARWCFSLSYAALLQPVVIMTATAACCDCLALNGWPALYSNSTEIAFHGAALILWGAGLGILLPLYLHLQQPQR